MTSDANALLLKLPASGLPAGNGALRESLGWDEARYELVTAGLAEKGRGRGGSLRRAGAAPVPSSVSAPKAAHTPDLFSLPQDAPARAAAPKPAPSPAMPTASAEPPHAASEQQVFFDNLDKKLWNAADRLRRNLDAAVYKHAVLGLIFLKYVSDAFKLRQDELEAAFRSPDSAYYLDRADYDSDDAYTAAIAAELEDRDYYTEKNVFWVPPLARWKLIQDSAAFLADTPIPAAYGITPPYTFRSVARLVDDALEAIEKENPKLKGIIERNRYMQLQLEVGIDFNFGKQPADTFSNDQHPDLRADYVMANPPFNMSEWWSGKLEDDPRWAYGVPPESNANFAWVQHMLYHLAPHGSMALLLANGSMSSNTKGEGDIRQKLIEADLVECMLALPGQLFTNTQIPACVWFLTKNKKARGPHRDRSGHTLFIDARKLGFMKSRVLRDFSPDDLDKITRTFHAWKRGQGYDDITGFCNSATIAEMAANGFVLTPGRYVGAEEVEEDDEPFDEKMARLTAELKTHFAESAKLEALICKNLQSLGYDC